MVVVMARVLGKYRGRMEVCLMEFGKFVVGLDWIEIFSSLKKREEIGR